MSREAWLLFIVVDARTLTPRSILSRAPVVINFNDWGEWAAPNIQLQIDLVGAFFPGIVTYTSKNYEPSVVSGIPALNLDFCEGGAGHHIGLKAQKCTGMALLRYPGHLGYVVTNDGEQDARDGQRRSFIRRSTCRCHAFPLAHAGLQCSLVVAQDEEAGPRLLL